MLNLTYRIFYVKHSADSTYATNFSLETHSDQVLLDCVYLYKDLV